MWTAWIRFRQRFLTNAFKPLIAKVKFKYVGLSAVFVLFGILICQETDLLTIVKKELYSYLTYTDKLPGEESFDGVYILGGSQASLKEKYKTVARLYAREICKEIDIPSRKGKTEYCRALRRNLTNDEWSLRILNKYRVPTENVKIVNVAPGFFGTYSEARGVSRIAEEKGWKSLLLITSPHHTKRVKKSFAHFLKGTKVDIWVVGSDYRRGFFELLNEFVKLIFYQIFLLR